MTNERRSFKKTLGRWMRLSCPVCGEASIVQSPFKIKHHCSACRALFKREDGFFVGAMAANVITTELVILAVYVLWLFTISGEYDLMIGVLFAVGLTFPLAFYHHSWSSWLCFDYLIESLPKCVDRGSD